MAMGKWQSAVFGTLYNKTDNEAEPNGAAGGVTAAAQDTAKTEKSGKSKWQESILSAIYGETSKESPETAAPTKEQLAEAKVDPVAVAERIFAKADSKRNSVLGILGSFAGGGMRGDLGQICTPKMEELSSERVDISDEQ